MGKSLSAHFLPISLDLVVSVHLAVPSVQEDESTDNLSMNPTLGDGMMAWAVSSGDSW